MQKQTFQAPTFSPNKKGEFGQTVRKRVNEYFKTNNISRTGDYRAWIKIAVIPMLFLVPFIIILFNSESSNLILLYGLWLLMGLGLAGMGLSIMHDACHGSLSKNKKVNNFIGQAVLNLVAGSSINWKIQHNVLHHSYTNIDGYDEDISPLGLMRLSPNQPKKSIYRYQAFYAWFFYGLMTFTWATFKDFSQLPRFNKMGLLKMQGKSYQKEFTALIIRKIAYFIVFLALPIYMIDIPWYHIILGWFSMHFLTGLILGIIFQCAHITPTTSYPPINSDHELENDMSTHQMLTTANFANNNKLLSWFIGGLNFQIEHHLFPNICHIHHPAIATIVKETALEFGIPYHNTPSFRAALIGHAKFLNVLGK